MALIHELHKNGHSIRAIAKQIGKSVGTVHRILNEQ
ncbi:helix-turn-helix domain-containing protein [Eubacterium ventriosum]